jgi:two-component system, LuxR family, response regulator FixJ
MPAASTVVHVIDDDDAARDSLSFLLRTAKLDVRTYESAPAFLAAIKTLSLGCIITDVRMPEMTGIELLRRLRESGNDVPVIVITGHGDIPLAVEAMKFGAVDFFEKPYDDESMVAAVRSALNRHEGVAQKQAQRSILDERLATLSNRERQVLEGLVAGKPNKIIAFDHGISPRTVEVYRANVMSKMQASSLSELVRMALIAGILNDGSGPKRR